MGVSARGWKKKFSGVGESFSAGEQDRESSARINGVRENVAINYEKVNANVRSN